MLYSDLLLCPHWVRFLTKATQRVWKPWNTPLELLNKISQTEEILFPSHALENALVVKLIMLMKSQTCIPALSPPIKCFFRRVLVLRFMFSCVFLMIVMVEQIAKQ